MTLRPPIVLTALAGAVMAVLVTSLAMWSVEPHRPPPPGIAAGGALAGLISGTLAGAIFSRQLTRRLKALEARARRYTDGDFSKSTVDYGQDEIGSVSRMLDALTHHLANRLAGLEADRARMAAILSGMIEGVLVVNAQGRLQLANEAARRMLRIDDPIEGRHYPEIVRQPAVARQIEAALAGQPTESVELTGLRDGAVTLIARTAPVEVSPGRGAVVVLHDITDLRRADRIRRDFVANVSHELRTPLTAIRGYVEALGDADPEESRRFLEIVSRHTLRMERLVRDLLRLARLDAGQEILDRVACSVEGLFSAVEGDLSGLLTSRRQTVERLVAPDAATVHGDPAKLQDALRNLLENATSHSPEGGRIVMAAARQGERLVITVTDEGPGIPPNDLTRIFERFYRVDKSRTRDGKDPGGTGLGLSIVRHLVELHGGRVSAVNRPEHGAVFTVELPAEG